MVNKTEEIASFIPQIDVALRMKSTFRYEKSRETCMTALRKVCVKRVRNECCRNQPICRESRSWSGDRCVCSDHDVVYGCRRSLDDELTPSINGNFEGSPKGFAPLAVFFVV